MSTLESRIERSIKEKEYWDELESKSVVAITSLSIDVHCPHCDDYQDRAADLKGELPNHSLSVSDIESVITCNNCQKPFLVTGIEY